MSADHCHPSPSNSRQETTNSMSHVTVVAGLLLTLDHYQPRISLRLHIKYCNLDGEVVARPKLASTPGRSLEEERPSINCLCIREIFRILSSNLDHKLNHPRRARTTLRSKVNIYGTIIRRVYGKYTITRFLR